MYTFLNFKWTDVIKLFMELNDNIIELNDSIGEFWSPSHPKCAARSRSACDAACSHASSRAANLENLC